MTLTRERKVSGLFVFAFVFAAVSIGATLKNNQEIAQRRLADPVAAEGTLIASRCTSFVRGAGGPKPYAVLTYEYMSGAQAAKHVLVATHWFDTLADCAAFERRNSSKRVLWYERTRPEKASLHRTEAYSWGFLYGLLPAVLFLAWAIADQRSINKTRNNLRKRKAKL